MFSATFDSTQRHIHIRLGMFEGRMIFGAEGHDFMIRFNINLVEDALAQKLLIVGGRGLTNRLFAVHLESTRPDLVGNKTISLSLRL